MLTRSWKKVRSGVVGKTPRYDTEASHFNYNRHNLSYPTQNIFHLFLNRRIVDRVYSAVLSGGCITRLGSLHIPIITTVPLAPQLHASIYDN